MAEIKIELLADHPETIPALKDLFEFEWEPYYGEAGPGDAEKDLTQSANRSELPIALVAFLDDSVCGTAALKQTSVTTFQDYSPWLAALVVDGAYRNLGIGTQLITRIEQLAKGLGYREIYVGAGEKSGISDSFLHAHGWMFLDKSDYFVSEARIYRKDL